MLSAICSNLVTRAGLCLIASGLLIAGLAIAQSDADIPREYYPAELDELVGRVALYPDDLLAIILPASAYPLQIVQAARYLEEYEKSPDLEPSDDWDDSVVALLNYPEIIELMNQDLDWTWQLGEAVVNQQPAVLEAIQRFRDRAYLAGNLSTDERQIISSDEGVIEIQPADPEVIYVPYYEPELVVIYQPRPVYHYYPHPYPVYYYPYPPDDWFAWRPFWGVTTFYTLTWLSDGLHLYHHDHDGHPYHRRAYRTHHYVRHHYRHSSHDVYVTRSYPSRHISSDRTRHERRFHGEAWRPKARHGAGPGYRQHERHREPISAPAFNTARLRDDVKRGTHRTRNTKPVPMQDAGRRSALWPDRGAVKRNRTIRKHIRRTAISRAEPTTPSDRQTASTILRTQRREASTRTPERRDTRSTRARIKGKSAGGQKRMQVRHTKPVKGGAKARSNIRMAQNTTRNGGPAKNKARSKDRRAKR